MKLEENSLVGGRYRLTRQVGRGSFGEVWLARDEQGMVDVAIKIYIALDENGLKDFREEYSSTYQLNHQNLLHASNFDIDGDRPFLVMPYCPGSALSLIGKTDETEIWKFIRDVASGLEYLHELDIVHRDIKPDNILRDAQGHYLITDFGVSLKMKSTLRRNSTRSQNTGDFSGTLSYMGPEMFSKNPNAVKATDIWALGVALYEILVGELPFFGQGGGMLLHGAEIPDIPSQWSENLANLICSCLAAETWNRPTATQLKEFADSVLKGQNPTWSSTTQTPEQPRTPANSPRTTVPQNATAPQNSTEPTSGSRTKTIIISAIAAAVILIVGLFFLLSGPSTDSTYTECLADSVADADVQVEKDTLTAVIAQAEKDSIVTAPIAGQQHYVAEKKHIPEEPVVAEKFAAERAATEWKRQQPELFDETFTVNGVSFKMVGVQGGTFDMGATPEQGGDAHPNETFVHSVSLSSFRMGETEVTQELWQAVMGSNPRSSANNSLQCPIEFVSWDDCQSFLSKLNQMTGKNFRLPTEAEWEFAARGGNKSKGYKYSGSDNLGSVAWYKENSGDCIHEVKMKSPNELGIYDMSGNVWEWCSDWYWRNYPSDSVTDPKGPSSVEYEYRVNRGGSYSLDAVYCRVSARRSCPSSGYLSLGLRLAL